MTREEYEAALAAIKAISDEDDKLQYEQDRVEIKEMELVTPSILNSTFNFYLSDGSAEPPYTLRCAVHNSKISQDINVEEVFAANKEDTSAILGRVWLAAIEASKMTAK